MTISRRDILIGAQVAGAAALLDGCKPAVTESPYMKSQLKAPVPGSAGLQKGHEELVTSVCGQCQAGCGIQVRVVQGRAVKIDGIEEFPINRGSIGPKGQSGTGVLYHADRITGPLKRDGARGSGKWIPVKWEDAIAEIGATLAAQRVKGEARGLVVISGEPRGPMRDLWTRFTRAYGTPNLQAHRATTDGAMALASLYMQGVNEVPAYDWDRTRYMLGLGTSHLESWCQTIHMMRASSTLRHGLQGKRVKFVQVAPRYSTTSIKADEWVPISPATYGSFALGLAHVLVRDKLYDAKFVAEHTFGFEDFKGADGAAHQGFKSVVLEEGKPETVSAATGIPVEVIERIAHEMVEFRPAIVVADNTVGAATNGLSTAMAVSALNALLGNIERAGGVVQQQRAPLADWKAFTPDAAATAGLANPRLDGAKTAAAPLAEVAVHHLPQAILAGAPYAAQAVFLHYSNPAFSKPGGKAWLNALEKVPLVVSFSPFPDESTFSADFVLPDHTYLERWEYQEPAPALGQATVGLRQPAVVPLHNTRQSGEVVVKIAQAIGGSVAEAFGWESYRAALEERLAGLAKQPGASTDAEDLDGVVEAMKTGGGWWKKETTLDTFEFATPSKKFEFYSQAIAARYPSGGDRACLPHFDAPKFAGDEKEFPYVLLPYRAVNYAEGGIRHLRRLVELPLVSIRPRGERIEVSAEDAETLGLRPDELVLVETPAGSRALHVLIRPGVKPGTLALPLGYGTWPPKQGEVTGGYPLLVATAEDPLAAVFAATGTRAKIRRQS